MLLAIANSNDIADLVSLLSVLFSQEEEFSPDNHAQVRGLSLIIENPAIGHIIVAREHGKLVGMVNLLYTISTALGGKVCILEDMIVSPEARCMGVGSEIIKYAISYAQQAGCMRITLLTDNSNIAAQRFYGRFGFEVSAMLPLRLSLRVTP